MSFVIQKNIHLINKQSGFTLIESILALFVMTIGLLGVAGLQMEGLRSANLAMQRTVVTIKSQDLLDRMRANAKNIGAYGATAPAASQCNSGANCSGSQMVAHDLYMWVTDLNESLPGTVTYSINAVPVTDISGNAYTDPDTGTVINQLVTINVNWSDRGADYSYLVTVQI